MCTPVLRNHAPSCGRLRRIRPHPYALHLSDKAVPLRGTSRIRPLCGRPYNACGPLQRADRVSASARSHYDRVALPACGRHCSIFPRGSMRTCTTPCRKNPPQRRRHENASTPCRGLRACVSFAFPCDRCCSDPPIQRPSGGISGTRLLCRANAHWIVSPPSPRRRDRMHNLSQTSRVWRG